MLVGLVYVVLNVQKYKSTWYDTSDMIIRACVSNDSTWRRSKTVSDRFCCSVEDVWDGQRRFPRFPLQFVLWLRRWSILFQFDQTQYSFKTVSTGKATLNETITVPSLFTNLHNMLQHGQVRSSLHPHWVHQVSASPFPWERQTSQPSSVSHVSSCVEVGSSGMQRWTYKALRWCQRALFWWYLVICYFFDWLQYTCNVPTVVGTTSTWGCAFVVPGQMKPGGHGVVLYDPEVPEVADADGPGTGKVSKT